ncbi:hypothetical protein BX600DRAFT_433128 [Xylariales sp. PMI_506]|nr:hypothetical protein BX600DRAFT_433128 [Xylariales sp. PMI_506]
MSIATLITTAVVTVVVTVVVLAVILTCSLGWTRILPALCGGRFKPSYDEKHQAWPSDSPPYPHARGGAMDWAGSPITSPAASPVASPRSSRQNSDPAMMKRGYAPREMV